VQGFEDSDSNRAGDTINVGRLLQPFPDRAVDILESADVAALCKRAEDEAKSVSDSGSSWEVLSEPDAQSVGSDWYERDLDVLSIASDACHSLPFDASASRCGDDQLDRDYAMALLLDSENEYALRVEGDKRWSCSLTAKECLMCSAPPMPTVTATLSPDEVSRQEMPGPLAGTSGDALKQPSDREPNGRVAVQDLSIQARSKGDEDCARKIASANHADEWQSVLPRRQPRRAKQEPQVESGEEQAERLERRRNVAQDWTRECESDLCTVATALCDACPTTDRDGDVWSGGVCPRRGVKAKVRSRCRWPQQA